MTKEEQLDMIQKRMNHVETEEEALARRECKKSKEYRHPCGVRFDLLVPEFLQAIAHIAEVGSKKYGDNNWRKGLSGENSGLNHAFAHLCEYAADMPCDYGAREMHLAQVAWNCMAEFHFERQRRLEVQK